jgi:predicted dehydrogenase
MVGCGGMGLRHAHGYVEARRTFEGLQLAAVCDLHEQAALRVADEVERATGHRPRVYTDFDRMLAQEKAIDAVEVVTDTRMHHKFAISALQAGKHVMTEKPMGLTLKACHGMADAAAKNRKVLSVAENFRRDPLNRLARHIIERGIIGRPLFALDIAVSGGSKGVMHGTAWRARKDHAGGVVMDAGVHNADLLLYLMGEAGSVSAHTAVSQPHRAQLSMSQMNANLASFYRHREAAEGAAAAELEQDAVDTAFATVRFKSGAVGQLTMTDTSKGHRIAVETVHGSEGTLLRSPSRSGKPVELRMADGSSVSGQALLDLVPDWSLDDRTAALWGAERLAAYQMPWDEIDRKVIAIEYQELSEVIEQGGQPEVGPREGMAALALLYAVLESGHAGGAPVAVDDVISGKVAAYQESINRAAGLAR